MYFNSFNDFMAMGGYADYVWSSFGITFVCGLILVLQSSSRRKRIFRSVEQEILRQSRIRAVKEMENTDEP